METTIQTVEEAEQIIRQQTGRVFSCLFQKADGTLREMVCRTGVKKHTLGKLPPGKRREEDKSNACLTVFDFQKEEYRRIPLSRLREIRASGQTYRFQPLQPTGETKEYR